jgi:hypothetical protein
MSPFPGPQHYPGPYQNYLEYPEFCPDQFRECFPEFSDIVAYPNSMIEMWARVAGKQVNPRRWRDETLLGIQLYVAHEITLASGNLRTGGVGGAPGSQSGPTNSKTVGSVTASYDTQQTAEKDAGWWNLTTYGKQFIHLARIFGAGVSQV